MTGGLKSLAIVSLIAGLTCVAVAAPPALLRSRSAPAEVKWHNHLPSAHKQAVAENKPILIVFGAEWCGFCTKLEKQTLKSPEVSQTIQEWFVPVHLDFDNDKRIADILEVKSLPCCVVISPGADLLGRIEGFQGPVPFQQKLNSARQLYYSIQPVSSPAPVLR
ncbi:MAG TPA: thioredoxin family protein [Planctomicrobium sp.]|nr:thioredoxin family protein [Planctomicrobium sp.]